MISIRQASSGDAADIARVLVQSWRTTYAGIVDQSYIDSLSVDAQTRRWQSRLDDGTGSVGALLAQDESGRVVGFAAGGRIHESYGEFDADLYALYLIAEVQGRGVGRRVVTEWARLMISGGFRSAIVRVVTANPTCSFYEHLGARPLRQGVLELAGASYPETWYGWDDLSSVTL